MSRTVLASWLRVFGAALLTAFLIDLTQGGSLDVFSNWGTWVVAGLVSVLPVIINWLNPNDPRYGRVHENP
jgi:hypothetical protein